MDISVVIPVYGCRACLEELHQRLSAALAAITPSYEIVLVNDACPQNSWEVIKEIALKDPRVKGIDLSRNFGQIRAVLHEHFDGGGHLIDAQLPNPALH